MEDALKAKVTDKGIGIIEFILIGSVGMALFLALLGGNLATFITTIVP